MRATPKKEAAPSGGRGKEWYDSACFDDLRVILEAQDQRRANAEARYLIDKLHLKRGQTFLDCPCGIGRISIPMAKQGVRVTGVDLTPSYLTAHESKADRAGVSIPLVHADMRRIDYVNRFDAAGNLGTSFGFFEREQDDLFTVKRLYRALKPGGRAVVNTVNRDWIIAGFQSRGYDQYGDTILVQERRLDYRTSVLHSTWTFIKGTRRFTHNISIRLYTYRELLKLFERAGFIDIEGYGDTGDKPVHYSRKTMWLFGTKPK